MSQEQLFFNFDVDFGNAAADRTLPDSLLKTAALKWIEEQEAPPDALALNVPTRLKKYQADIAASWSVARRNPVAGGVYKLLHPNKTMIVECRSSVAGCWPDASRSRELFDTLHDFKSKFAAVKELIKVNEPQLKTDGNLFDEFAEWDFDSSVNPEYHYLRRRIDEVSYSVYHGTYFERLHRAKLADLMYLAVPAEMLMPSEIAEGWGLLWVHDDLSVEEVVSPVADECTADNRLHLIQNIASTAKRAVLFSQGVLKSDSGVQLLKKPKRRRVQLDY